MDKAKIAAETDPARVNEIMAAYSQQKRALISQVQKIQSEFGYIPPQSIPIIAKAMGLFPSQVQGVISFYEQLYTKPRGRNIVRVCQGPACHVWGGAHVLREVGKQLGIKLGETTDDFKYTLEAADCFGLAALAPVMMIGKNVYGRMTPTKVRHILADTK